MSPETCSADHDHYSHTYCAWSYDAEEDEHDWDCGSGLFCEAFADGYCIYGDTNITYTDCDGNTGTFLLQNYFQCCDGGDNCNHDISNVDTDNCVRSTAYENMYKNYYDCIYETGSALYTYGCDDDVDEITCDGLTALFRQQAECQCGLYGDIYSEVSSSTQTLLQEEIDEGMESFSDWNDIFGCSIQLSCNLATGGTVLGSSGVEGKSYFIAFIWSLIVYIVNQ